MFSDRGRRYHVLTAAAAIKEGTPCEYRKIIKRDNTVRSAHLRPQPGVALAEGHGMTAAGTPRARAIWISPPASASTRWATVTPPGCRPSATRPPRLQHTSNLYYTAPCGKLAKKLCRRTGMDAVFLWQLRCRGQRGRHQGRPQILLTDTYGAARNKVITLVNSFHGRTLATLTATGQDVFHQYFGPFPEQLCLCTRR